MVGAPGAVTVAAAAGFTVLEKAERPPHTLACPSGVLLAWTRNL